MKKYWFNLMLPEQIIRKMNRATYYATHSYLRNVRRIVAASLDKKENRHE